VHVGKKERLIEAAIDHSLHFTVNHSDTYHVLVLMEYLPMMRGNIKCSDNCLCLEESELKTLQVQEDGQVLVFFRWVCSTEPHNE
jgi:hypothetical protein